MWILYIVLGFIGGILGGMGLGGGTLLIPLLISFTRIIQQQAQFINLFSFVLMSIFVLIIHFKNKLVDVFPAIFIATIGTVFATISAILVGNLNSNVLKIMFGIFLIIIGLFQSISLIAKTKENKKD